MKSQRGKAWLVLASALLFTGCNEDEPLPPPVKPPVREQPVAGIPVPIAKPVVNPVDANWAETGYQGLDGKQWSTWWIAAAENPESVVDIVAGHVKKDWPAESELKTTLQSAAYKIPVHKNEFGEIRFASIAVNVSPDEGVRIGFKANSRADDLAQVGKVLRAEAELLCRLTSGGGVNASSGDLQEWIFDDLTNVIPTARWNIQGKVWEGLLKDATHTGLDYAGPEGTPVYSVSDGIVVKITNGAVGHTLADLSIVAIYNKSANVTFMYLHMKEIVVVLNEKIEAGQQIGQIAQRGPATGPHLHFEARPGEQFFVALDVNNTVDPYEAAKDARGHL